MYLKQGLGIGDRIEGKAIFLRFSIFVSAVGSSLTAFVWPGRKTIFSLLKNLNAKVQRTVTFPDVMKTGEIHRLE